MPVVDGGTNELHNLVTSCLGCNLGKGGKALSDNSAVAGARDRLDEAQARREQLEMIAQWNRDLNNSHDHATQLAEEALRERVPNKKLSQVGRDRLSLWVKRYGLSDVLTGVNKFADRVSAGSDFDETFDLIARVARVEGLSREDPSAKDIAYICGILKSRFAYWVPQEAGQIIRVAISWSVPIMDIQNTARAATSWMQFCIRMGRLIDKYYIEAESDQS